MIDDFRIEPSALEAFAFGLARPECVLPDPDGSLWVSDQRGSLCHVDPQGLLRVVGCMGGVPNGFARDPDGLFWIADIEGGRVCRMSEEGLHQVVIDRIGDETLGSANFVLCDSEGDLWLSVSTRTVPRSRALAEPVADGSVYRIRRQGPRQWSVAEAVATGFHFTNELRLDRDRRWLYVAETALGRISRLPLDAAGRAGTAEVFGPGPLFHGAHVDGIVFDSAGNLWVTEIRRNAILVIDPAGKVRTVCEDPEGRFMRKPTSLCFAGPDLRTVIIGSLVDDHLKAFRAPVAGLPPVHWAWARSRAG